MATALAHGRRPARRSATKTTQSPAAAAALVAASTLPLLMELLMMAAGVPTASAAPVEALVIGAGVAGLKAAADLAAKGYSVTVLEARDRIGGRIHTIQTAYGPLELGAQWIHGSTNPIVTLAKQRGWKRVSSSLTDGVEYEARSPTSASEVSDADEAAWDALFADLEEHVARAQNSASDSASLQSAIDSFKSARGLGARAAAGLDARVDNEWVQEYAASPSKLSLNWFDNDKALTGGDSILTGGYKQVVDYLASQLAAKGGRVVLSAPVARVAYDASSRVTVTTTDGRAFGARFAVVTLPLGVLQANSVAFSPPLPAAKRGAINRLGMGTLNKVVLAFPTSASWPNVNWIDRLPLASDAGRWREFFSLRKTTGKPLVVAFNAGDAALYPQGTTDAALAAQATGALRAMFPGVPAAPDAAWVTRWDQDPYSLGSYSVVPPGARGADRGALAEPAGGDLLFFAGEAASKDYPATVQGAFLTGQAAAAKAAAANKISG